MKKQLKAIGIIMVFMLTSILPFAAFAADDATITVGAVSGTEGETVSVPVTISGQPVIAGYEMVVNFDNTKLEYKGFTADTGIFPTPGATNEANANTNEAVIFIGMNLENAAKTDMEVADGTLITLSFTVLDDSEDIPLSITGANLMKANNNTVAVNVIDGKIIVPETYKIEVGTVRGTKDEMVSVPVSIIGRPMIAGYEMTVNFDNTKLEYKGFTADTGIFPMPGATEVENTDGAVIFIGMNLENATKTDMEVADGTLITLNFTVLDDSEDIPVSITNEKLMNADNNSLRLNVTDGKIIVILIDDADYTDAIDTDAIEEKFTEFKEASDDGEVYNAAGTVIASAKGLGTGAYYVDKESGKIIVIIVKYDISGDGVTEQDDVTAILNYLNGKSSSIDTLNVGIHKYTEAVAEQIISKAVKFSGGAKIDIEDIMKLMLKAQETNS